MLEQIRLRKIQKEMEKEAQMAEETQQDQSDNELTNTESSNMKTELWFSSRTMTLCYELYFFIDHISIAGIVLFCE